MEYENDKCDGSKWYDEGDKKGMLKLFIWLNLVFFMG